MTVIQKNDNSKITIIPEGWLNSESSPQLEEIIKQIESAKELVIDFEKVEYISSAGIRVLLVAHNKAKEINAGFSLLHVNREVMNILMLTGLDAKICIKND